MQTASYELASAVRQGQSVEELGRGVDALIKNFAELATDHSSANAAVKHLKALSGLTEDEGLKEKLLGAILEHNKIVTKLDKGFAVQNTYFVAQHATPGSQSDIEAARQFGELADDRSQLKPIGAFRVSVEALRIAPEASTLAGMAALKAYESYGQLDIHEQRTVREEVREGADLLPLAHAAATSRRPLSPALRNLISDAANDPNVELSHQDRIDALKAQVNARLGEARIATR